MVVVESLLIKLSLDVIIVGHVGREGIKSGRTASTDSALLTWTAEHVSLRKLDHSIFISESLRVFWLGVAFRHPIISCVLGSSGRRVLITTWSKGHVVTTFFVRLFTSSKRDKLSDHLEGIANSVVGWSHEKHRVWVLAKFITISQKVSWCRFRFSTLVPFDLFSLRVVCLTYCNRSWLRKETEALSKFKLLDIVTYFSFI